MGETTSFVHEKKSHKRKNYGNLLATGTFGPSSLPMIKSYARAFKQLDCPRFIKPLIYSLGLAAITALAVLAIAYVGFEWANEPLLQWLEAGEAWWASVIKWSLRVLGFLLLVVFLFFLFGTIQVAYLGLFIDGIVDAALDRHHPDLLPNPPTLR